MPINTVSIKKDVDSKPIPQYYSSANDAYEGLQGAGGANWVTIYDGSGNPVSVVSNKLAVRATEIETLLAGGLPAALSASGNLKAAIQESIPAGDNNIGNVDIASAIPTGTNTIGAVKAAGNDTMLQGNISLTGSAQQINSNTACKVVTIQAEPTNTGYVYVGNISVSATVHMYTLAPGSSVTITCSNLNLLYVIGTSGDKVCYGGEA